MRTFWIRKGKFTGEYPIYDSVEEFRANNPKDLWHWAKDHYSLYKTGDYIVAEDGFVVPLLSTYQFKQKATTNLFRFPQGTFSAYERKDGTVKYSSFKALYTNGHTNSVGGVAKNSLDSNKEKIRFAILVGQGIDMRKAYFLAYANKNKMYVTNQVVESRIHKLIKDEIVIEELRNFMNPLLEKLKNKFTTDRLVDELDKLVEESVPGSAVRRDNIEFVLKLMNTLHKEEEASNKRIEADYEAELPPAL